MENRISDPSPRRILSYSKTPVIAAVIVVFLDLILLEILFGSVSRIMFVLVLFLEGSLGLIAGAGIAISSTPFISKIGEMTVGRSAWSRESEKNAEKVAGKWITASALIILIGFSLSII